MPLARTKTVGMEDIVLSAVVASATTAELLRVVCPIDGMLQRVLLVRGGAHTAGETVIISINGLVATAVVLPSGGAIRTCDTIELTQNSLARVNAGGVISFQTTGTPPETTSIGVFFVVQRL